MALAWIYPPKPSKFFTENISEIISLSPKTLNNFGILVSAITAVVFSTKKSPSLWPTLDALTPLMVLLVMEGHLANFANGDAFGLPTELPWALEIWGGKTPSCNYMPSFSS